MERGDVLRRFVFLFLLLSGGCTMIGKPNAMTQYSDAMSRRSDGTARQLLAEAQRLADAGDTDGAMNLIKRANASPANDKDSQRRVNERDASSHASKRSLTAWWHRLRSKEPEPEETADTASPFQPSRERNLVDKDQPARQTTGIADSRAAEETQTHSQVNNPLASVSAADMIRNRVEQDMSEATPEEREEMSQYLQTVDPSMVGAILKAWRMTHRIGQKSLMADQIATASSLELSTNTSDRPSETGAQGESNIALAQYGHSELAAPDPRQAGYQRGLGPINPWNLSPRRDTQDRSVSGTEQGIRPASGRMPIQNTQLPEIQTAQPNAQASARHNPVQLGFRNPSQPGVLPNNPIASTTSRNPLSVPVSESLPNSVNTPRPDQNRPDHSHSTNAETAPQPTLPGWDGLRNVIQNAGQGLQHGLTGARLGLDFGQSETTPENLPERNFTAITSTNADQTPEQLLQQLIALLESDVAQSSPGQTDEQLVDYIHKHVNLRMLYLIAGQQERALEAIPVVEPADQEFWQQMFWAITNYFDNQGIPDSAYRATQTVAQLKTAALRLQEHARLDLRNVNFCHKISSYGNYERFSRDEFTPGQPVLLYAEVENFKSEPTSDGQYRTILKSTIEFYKAGPNGDLIDQITFPATEDLCRNQRRDYFHSYEIAVPQNISLGPHVLKLTVEDQLSQKIATYSLNFTVK